jgi:HD superfamily phosphohydrolase
VRTSALLHDCGHGPFSHSSEEIYEFFDDMQEVIGPGGILEDMHPHEVLAYCIVRTSAFKRKFEEFITNYKQPPIDLGEVADMIVGKATITNKYIVDMINRPFDADKLDYIFRDSHFSGLPLNIDLDRLWYSTQILPITEKKFRSLVTNLSGTTPLEQILFSKMVLYSAVYHHHKVRACDCMLKAFLEYCQKNDEEIGGRKIRNSTDFLWLTDDVIFSEADSQKRGKDDQIHKLIHNIKFRRLFKRALVISRATVEKESMDFFDYDTIKTLSLGLKECDNNLRKLAKEICDTAGNPCDELYVWVDLPKLPPIGSADDTYINEGTITKPHFAKLKSLFPVDDWAEDHAEHKWKGYVFFPNEEETREKIAEAAKAVLEQKFNIRLNSLSIELSHPE